MSHWSFLGCITACHGRATAVVHDSFGGRRCGYVLSLFQTLWPTFVRDRKRLPWRRCGAPVGWYVEQTGLICVDVNQGVRLRSHSCTLDGDTMPDCVDSHSALFWCWCKSRRFPLMVVVRCYMTSNPNWITVVKECNFRGYNTMYSKSEHVFHSVMYLFAQTSVVNLSKKTLKTFHS